MTHLLGWLSAVLALVVGAIYAVLLLIAARATTTAYDFVLMLPVFLCMLIPFGAGIIALLRRRTLLLGVAWGWMLGVNVPHALNRLALSVRPLALPPIRNGNIVWVVGPDYFGIAMVALALAGLGLCIADEYAQSAARRA